MSEYIRKIKPFWCAKMNNTKLEDLSPYLKKPLYFGYKYVPVKCCNSFEYIKNNSKALLKRA